MTINVWLFSSDLEVWHQQTKYINIVNYSIRSTNITLTISLIVSSWNINNDISYILYICMYLKI